MQITITIPNPAALLRQWKWALLALLVLALLVIVLAAHGGTGPARAAFPGANGKIAFTSERDGNPEIYVMNADGSAPTRLTNNTAGDYGPAWSANGARIAFNSDRDGNHEIYVMNADGSAQTNLTNNTAADYGAYWSPDGMKIAFTSDRDGNPEIYVMNADGSGQTNLTNNPQGDFIPAWSPDGTKIAFDSDRDGDSEIYVMNADGSAQTRLTNNSPAFDHYADWSPDGAKIAFASNRAGPGSYGPDVYVMDPVDSDGDGNGDNLIRLTFDLIDHDGPAWSPDGTKIAFRNDRDGPLQVYVMNADGSGQTNLTGNSSQNYGPDWQPLVPPTPTATPTPTITPTPTPSGPAQLNITNLGQYALPKTCFQVENGLDFTPLFHVCDDDFQPPLDTSSVCAGDGVCEDENPADGAVVVTVLPGSYVISESTTPPQHSPPIAAQACNATAGPCALTFMNAPKVRPWHPWDLTGPNGVPDGFVRIQDILAVLQHYHDDKPLN